MKKMKKGWMGALLILILGLLVFTGCPSPPQSAAVDYGGGVFKGPFLVGSTVEVYPLDGNLEQIGTSYSGDIVSDDGTYDISGLNITGPVELIATGYYYDEIIGAVTDNQMTMRAITEETGTVNINLFTALEVDRVKALYAAGLSITDAKAQAVEEIFDAFGLTLYQGDSGDIGVSTANGAALLAVSSMFAYNRTPAAVQTKLTEMRVDFADGVVDTSDLTANAKLLDASGIKGHLETYYADKGLSVTVPSFKDELWDLFGSDTLTPDPGNYVQLSAAGTVELTAGFGHFDGFIIPDGTTVSFSINVDASVDELRFFETSSGDTFAVSSNNHFATATGPGYYRLDFMVAYPTTPYDFTMTATVNGVGETVNYRVVAQ